MKKKRVLALIMAALMTGGLMTGCGSSDSGSADITAEMLQSRKRYRKSALQCGVRRKIRRRWKDMTKAS